MLIGLTGGIGSGKSTIAQALRTRGLAVYDTDSEAKRILLEDTSVRQQMVELFGEGTYRDGVYQTKYVAEQVFRDKTLLMQLNRIVHPAVREDVAKWAERQEEVCFVESAILMESGLDALCQKIVLVTAPIEVRIQRTMQRDHATEEQVAKRIAAQMNEPDLRARAHIIINNDGTTPVEHLAEEILKGCSNNSFPQGGRS